MAKESGLGFSVCSLDTSDGTVSAMINDVTDLQFATPRAVLDWTGIDRSAHERGLGLADYSGSLKGVWNPSAAPAAHGVLCTATSNGAKRTLTLTVGSVAQTLAAEVLITQYQVVRATTGALTWSAPFQLGSGVVPTWS